MEAIDERVLKKMVVAFKEAINKNQQLRMKCTDNPSKCVACLIAASDLRDEVHEV